MNHRPPALSLAVGTALSPFLDHRHRADPGDAARDGERARVPARPDRRPHARGRADPRSSPAAPTAEGGEPATWVSLVKRRARRPAAQASPSAQWRGLLHAEARAGWMQAMDALKPRQGARSSSRPASKAVNPENLVLTAGAAAVIAGTGIPAGEQGDHVRCSSSSGRSVRACRWGSTAARRAVQAALDRVRVMDVRQ